MGFFSAIAALALFILGVLLFASAVGLVDGLIIMAGFALLGLLLRENDKAKRAKGGQGETDE
jgi:hypothetical protein